MVRHHVRLQRQALRMGSAHSHLLLDSHSMICGSEHAGPRLPRQLEIVMYVSIGKPCAWKRHTCTICQMATA